MFVLRRVFKFLASLKLAVILLLSLAVILGTATYYEARFDAKTAAHLVYGSEWFSLFLFMLGVNVLCAALSRYPWRKHQIGFVITHLGIITILIGSFVTRATGFEGSMALPEGGTGNSVKVDDPRIAWQVLSEPAGASTQPEAGPVHQIPAEFRWSPPSDDHVVRIPLSDGVTAVVDRYYHNARPVSTYRASEGGDPAVQVQISAGKGAPMPEGQVMATEWLSTAEEDRREVHMGPATLRIMKAASDEELQADLHPAGHEKQDLSDGVLIFNLTDRPVEVAVAGNIGREVPLADTGLRVRIDRYLPFAVVVNNQLVSRSNERNNPAVELTVLDGKGEAEHQILFAKYPEFSTSHHQKRPSHLKVTYTFDDPKSSGNGIDFVVGPDHKLYARSYSGDKDTVGAVEVNKLNATGWRMNLNYTVLDYQPSAAAEHEFVDVPAARGKDSLPPAIRMRFEGADTEGPYWLEQGDVVAVGLHNNHSILRLWYHLAELPLGFTVKLDKFEVGYDPGTRSAATYTSQVSLDDAARSKKFDATITMNEPLHYAGLTFFQASFQDGEGQAAPVSIFQVAKDPGIPIKYGGSILLVLGIATYVLSQPPRNKRRDDARADRGDGEEET